MRSVRDVMVRMTVLMAVWVRVRVLMLVCVGVILIEMHIELGASDAGALLSRNVEVITRQTEFRQLPLELVEVESEVEHRADEHVAADAAENVQVKSAHVLKGFRRICSAQADEGWLVTKVKTVTRVT